MDEDRPQPGPRPVKTEVRDAAWYEPTEERAVLVSCKRCNRIIRRPIRFGSENVESMNYCHPCWKKEHD